jgi:hypothetical protein
MKKNPHSDRKHIIPMIKFSPNVLKHSLISYRWTKISQMDRKHIPPDHIPKVKLAQIARKHSLISYPWKKIPHMDGKHSPSDMEALARMYRKKRLTSYPW